MPPAAKPKFTEFDLLDLRWVRALRRFHREWPQTVGLVCLGAFVVLFWPVLHGMWLFGKTGWLAAEIVSLLSVAAAIICNPWRHAKWLALVGAITLVAAFSLSLCRFEIRQGERFGIRIVPIGYGFPTDKTIARAQRGEVVLGGCVLGWEQWVVTLRLPGS